MATIMLMHWREATPEQYDRLLKLAASSNQSFD